MLRKFILGLLTLSCGFVMAKPTVYLVPHHPSWGKNWPSSAEKAKNGSWVDQLHWGLFGRLEEKLKEKGYDFKVSPMNWIEKYSDENLEWLFHEENPDRIVGIFFHGKVSAGVQKKLPRERCILLGTDNPGAYADYPKRLFDRNQSIGTILTWDDKLTRHDGFVKFYYPCLWPMKENLPSFDQRKLACLVLNNKWFCSTPEELYTERYKLIKYINQSQSSLVDLYGYHWAYFSRIWKGVAPHKLDKLKNYRFNFAIENSKNVEGWITERIFESFQMGCVPIYYGASNITDYVPESCFVDYRDFNSYDELFRFMQAFTEEDYDRYMVNIREFLNSDKAKKFTPDHFANTVISAFGLM